MDFRNEYRIVRDNFAGFAAEYRPWWSPFWVECYGCNTQSTAEKAEALANAHATPIVKHIGRLP